MRHACRLPLRANRIASANRIEWNRPTKSNRRIERNRVVEFNRVEFEPNRVLSILIYVYICINSIYVFVSMFLYIKNRFG